MLEFAVMHGSPAPLPGYRAVARAETADCPVTLHRRARDYVITACEQVLMGSEDTGSERALGRLAGRLLRGVRRPRVLVGGLGMGFTLRALLDELPREARVVVAELLSPVVRWNRRRFGHLSGRPLADPRVRVYVGDVADLVREHPAWDAVLLDVDNGPEWMVQRRNDALYDRRGLTRVLESLRPGGFLAVWSVEPHAGFERRLVSMGRPPRRFRRTPRAGRGYEPVIYVVER
jgi:spermidine synthase